MTNSRTADPTLPARLSRQIVVVAALSLCFVLSACGGGDDATVGAGTSATAVESTQTDSGRTFEGVFAGTTRTTESTVANDTEVGKDVERLFFLTCVDDDCAQVFLRSDVDLGRRAGGTWLFERDGDELTAADVREGPCNGVAGEYRQVLDWSWKAQEDGSLNGTLTQTFTGCKLDSTSSTETTLAAGATETPLPYLSSDDAQPVAAALSDYDAAFTQVSDGYAKCDQEPLGTGTNARTRCFARLLGVWDPALRKLVGYLESGPPADAAEGCSARWNAVEGADVLADRVAQARKSFVAGKSDATGQLTDALTRLQSFHPAITLLAYRCIAPAD